MKNERNAGRKSAIKDCELEIIRKRIGNGERVANIASEYGISRQALYKKLNTVHETLVYDYLVEGECISRLEIDFHKETVNVTNYGSRISQYAFGIIKEPSWKQFLEFMEKEYLRSINALPDRGGKCYLCRSNKDNSFSIPINSENAKIPSFTFVKKDILYSRTDTDGYQFKALSRDRKWFIKSQAIIAGTPTDDWKVEIIASDICKKLGIPAVIQQECDFVYGSRRLKAVYAANFELDGYSFVSFESLLERMGTSSKTDEFIRMGAIDKLKWCGKMLAQAGDLKYEDALKYMIDLALIDIIVGNVDRHTHNFGLFFNNNTQVYEIPLVFDNGMGLFFHDDYRGKYASFDEAMMRVYVAPYGEDPFDMYWMLNEEFNLQKLYPQLQDLKLNYSDLPVLAYEYLRKVQELWQK